MYRSRSRNNCLINNYLSRVSGNDLVCSTIPVLTTLEPLPANRV